MYVIVNPTVTATSEHDGLAAIVVGQVAVLLEELREELLDVLLIVLLEDTELDV